MTFKTIGEYVAAEPFRPFRMKVASGQSFDVRHPEMILLGKTFLRVYGPDNAENGNSERWHDVSLMLLETIEPLDAAGSAKT